MEIGKQVSHLGLGPLLPQTDKGFCQKGKSRGLETGKAGNAGCQKKKKKLNTKGIIILALCELDTMGIWATKKTGNLPNEHEPSSLWFILCSRPRKMSLQRMC